MMIIVNAEYRIASDEAQWIVQYLPRLKDADRRNPRWRNLGYFTSLDSALLSLAHRRVRLIPGTWGVDALPLLCAALDTLNAEITAALRSGDNPASTFSELRSNAAVNGNP